jgi:hypothetical protein
VIVDPDFLEHWRTRMVVDALGGDEMAPLYIIRIWSHCQQRKGDSFEMPSAGLKALCKYQGDAQKLESALIEAGFLARDGAVLKVPKWSEKNASLIAAWNNGASGGRPRKEPKENPRVSTTEPTANPDETQTKPIREEKRRSTPEAIASGSACAPKAKRGTVLPDDFEPNDTAHSLAASLGLYVAEELPKFRDYHTHKGTVGKDWQAGFRTWLTKASDFRGRLPRGSPMQSRDAARAIASATRLEDFVNDQTTFTRILG